MAPTKLTLTRAHLDLIRERRICTKWFANPEQYRTDNEGGWLREGLALEFRERLELEPYSALFHRGYKASIGSRSTHGLCSIGFMSYSYSGMPEGLRVGRYCSISSGIKFLDSQHPSRSLSTSVFMFRPNTLLTRMANEELSTTPLTTPPFDPVGGRYPTIGNDVWIGQDAVLRMGITIGDGAIIASNAVVTKDVPSYAIMAGNPARLKSYRFPEPIVDRFKQSQWWRYAFPDFKHLPLEDPVRFLDAFEQLEPELQPYEPRKLVLPDALLAI